MTPWRRHAFALALATALILLVFRSDVGDLARIWWTSTTFGHCLFIGPVIAWLVWQRRGELVQLTPTGWWPGLVLVAIGGFGWLMGDAASVGFARQLGLVMMLQGAVVTILGPNVARGLLFPLAYAVFLVPFGEGLEPPLQGITVAIVMPLLHLVGIPAVVDGVLIHAGRYYFEVAEACSGAKFVIAMVAFGVLVANLCFVSWQRRAVFLAVSVVVPVIANGFRAFGTIWAADLTSVEAATGFDHIVYGWVFFGLVMAGVLAIGWRWFDRAPDDPAFDPALLQAIPRHRTDLAVATALVLATAAVFPVWSGAVAGRAQSLPAHIDLPDLPGWRRVPVSTRAPWMPYYPGADHYLFGRYADASGATVDMSIAVFGSQHEGKELIAFGTGVLREEDRWVRVANLPDVFDSDGTGGSAVRITAPGPVERIVATWYRVGDATTHDETRVKIETMKARLLGGPQRAVAIHLSVEGADPRPIVRFLGALGPLDRVADHAAGQTPRTR
ncbi:exosortase A [Sphingomonas sp. 4RDLI-65]|uniref:exosortase A n=1 Tax=Sphingomonas sp. 4RDLI-65 TaxID=3111641 RepID=UPI003C2039F6